MSRRVYLPVLDRRMVLQGAAAALLASLGGCVATTTGDDSQGDGNVSGGGGGGGTTGGGGGSGAPDAGTTTTPLGPGLERCGSQLCLSLKDSANAALNTVEGARIFDIEGRKLIVVRVSSTKFVTLSAICTHQGCAVHYVASADDLECPCHGARFALDGAVKLGPASTPLATYPTAYDSASDSVKITLP
jgi:nitrite reductase/ring-hydroxylating ferredoxin subunit